MKIQMLNFHGRDLFLLLCRTIIVHMYLDVGFEQIASASLHHFVHHLHKSSRGRGPEIT